MVFVIAACDAEEMTTMMMLTIPDGDVAGACRINAEEAEFRLEPGQLSFRYVGETAWNDRKVIERLPTMAPRRDDPSGKPVPCHTYICADPGCGPDDYAIFG